MAKFLRGQAAIELPAATAGSLHGQAAIERTSLRSSAAGSLHGQAAMEYLVTYGWALLALFAVVAILISSGAFSSSNFSTQECTFQPDLPCSPFILYLDSDGATTLRYSMSNGLGFPIKLASVKYVTTDLGEAGRQEWTDGSIAGAPIFQSGDPFELTFQFPGSAQPRARDFKTIISTIEYYNCRGIELAADCNDETASKYITSGRISTIVEQG